MGQGSDVNLIRIGEHRDGNPDFPRRRVEGIDTFQSVTSDYKRIRGPGQVTELKGGLE